MITIKNQFLTVRIKPYGAELSGITDNQTGEEYIWQGEPSIWSGQAPVLFPIVSRLSSDSFFYDGKQYFLPKHGFARKSSFDIIRNDKTEAVFSLTSSEETRRVYPFDFTLYVAFSLENKALKVTHTVCNIGVQTMYFSIGAHPAFNLNIGDSVKFSEYENFITLLFDEYGLADGEKTLAKHRKNIVITEHIFDNDALFFRDLQSTSVKIVTKSGRERLEMTYDKVPFVGLWAKPGAPYICIEPWHGMADHPGVSGRIEEKPYIISLAPGDSFPLSYLIRIL